MTHRLAKNALNQVGQGLAKLTRRKAPAPSTQAPCAVLPIDIWEAVIDLVARQDLNEKAWGKGVLSTLRACALTCRAWTARSQYHLFRFLSVRCEAHSIAEVTALLDKHPALHTQVEVLVIKSASVSRPKLEHIPPEIPSLFPSVPEVRLSSYRITNAWKLRPTLGQFIALTTLDLYNLEFMLTLDLRRVISSFESLKTLHISAPSWSGDMDMQPPYNDRPPDIHLQDLYVAANASWLQVPRGIAFLEWLAGSGVVGALESLRLQSTMILDATTYIGVCALIRAAAKTLERVSLHPGLELDYTQLGDTLRQCQNLRHVTLVIPYHTNAFNHLLSFLEQNYIPPYLSIRLIHFSKRTHPAAQDWARLDNLLCSRRGYTPYGLSFSLIPTDASARSLSAGESYLTRPVDGDATRLFFRERLPRMSRRGIVKYWRGEEEGYKP